MFRYLHVYFNQTFFDDIKPLMPTSIHIFLDWVNLNKRGGMVGVFRGLAGLLRGISRGRGKVCYQRSYPIKCWCIQHIHLFVTIFRCVHQTFQRVTAVFISLKRKPFVWIFPTVNFIWFCCLNKYSWHHILIAYQKSKTEKRR